MITDKRSIEPSIFDISAWEDAIGSLEVGKAADFFLVDSRRLDFAGALFDDGALSVVAGISQNVDMTIVGGKVVVKEGRLVHIDEERVAISAQAAAERMLQTASKHTGIDYRFHRRVIRTNFNHQGSFCYERAG